MVDAYIAVSQRGIAIALSAVLFAFIVSVIVEVITSPQYTLREYVAGTISAIFQAFFIVFTAIAIPLLLIFELIRRWSWGKR